MVRPTTPYLRPKSHDWDPKPKTLMIQKPNTDDARPNMVSFIFSVLDFDGLGPREVREVIFNPPGWKFMFFPVKPQRFTIIREVGRLYILFLRIFFFFEDVPRVSYAVFDLPNLPTSLTISRNDVKQINRQWGENSLTMSFLIQIFNFEGIDGNQSNHLISHTYDQTRHTGVGVVHFPWLSHERIGNNSHHVI